MSSLKKKRREKFMKRVKQTEKIQINEKKDDNNNVTKLYEEAPSKLAQKRILNELKGRIGKKDLEEESR